MNPKYFPYIRGVAIGFLSQTISPGFDVKGLTVMILLFIISELRE